MPGRQLVESLVWHNGWQVGGIVTPEDFNEKIRLGKYTRWAKGMTEDQLEGLLWAVGEFGCRASIPLEVLSKHPVDDVFAHARAVTGLKIIADFARGEFITRDEVRHVMREALGRVESGETATTPESET